MTQVQAPAPPPKEKLDSLDYVELVMALEEVFEKCGGDQEKIDKALQAICEKWDLTPEQLEELRVELAEAARKGPQQSKLILTDKPTSTWAWVVFWVLMVLLGIVLWQMAMSGPR